VTFGESFALAGLAALDTQNSKAPILVLRDGIDADARRRHSGVRRGVSVDDRGNVFVAYGRGVQRAGRRTAQLGAIDTTVLVRRGPALTLSRKLHAIQLL